MMTDSPIVTATPADAEGCLAVLTLAFASDPPCRWAWPDPKQYLEAFPRFARAFGGGSLAQGTGHYYRGFAGVAFWLGPGAAPDEAAVIEIIRDTVDHARQDAMFSMFEQMDSFHPRQPHWHLPLIGVDLAHQGQGIGTALLRHVLSKCDGQKLPAYLEATSPHNVRLYERNGFERLGSIQVADSPPVVPMLRKPL